MLPPTSMEIIMTLLASPARGLAFILLATTLSVFHPTHSRAEPGALGNIRIALKNVVPNARIFDGTKLVTRDHTYAQHYLNNASSGFKRAITQFKRMTPADKDTPEAKKVWLEIRQKAKWLVGLQDALKAAKTQTKGGRQQCSDFDKAVMAPHRSTFGPILKLADKREGVLGDPNQIKRLLALGKRVAQTCAEPRWKDVGKHGCRTMKLTKNTDPELWCAAAKDAKKHVATGVRNYVQRDLALAMRSAQTSRDLKQKQGWIDQEAVTSWTAQTSLTAEAKQQRMKRYQAVYAAAGMTWSENPAWFVPFGRYFKEREATLRSLAKTLPMPPSGGKSLYSTAIIKKRVKKAHPGAKVKKVVMSPKGWLISKFPTGVPDIRRAHGHIMYKVPGEPFCQVRSFYAREKYRGGGKYQRANDVRWGYVRFQNCR